MVALSHASFAVDSLNSRLGTECAFLCFFRACEPPLDFLDVDVVVEDVAEADEDADEEDDVADVEDDDAESCCCGGSGVAAVEEGVDAFAVSLPLAGSVAAAVAGFNGAASVTSPGAGCVDGENGMVARV